MAAATGELSDSTSGLSPAISASPAIGIAIAVAIVAVFAACCTFCMRPRWLRACVYFYCCGRIKKKPKREIIFPATTERRSSVSFDKADIDLELGDAYRRATISWAPTLEPNAHAPDFASAESTYHGMETFDFMPHHYPGRPLPAPPQTSYPPMAHAPQTLWGDDLVAFPRTLAFSPEWPQPPAPTTYQLARLSGPLAATPPLPSSPTSPTFPSSPTSPAPSALVFRHRESVGTAASFSTAGDLSSAPVPPPPMRTRTPTYSLIGAQRLSDYINGIAGRGALFGTPAGYGHANSHAPVRRSQSFALAQRPATYYYAGTGGAGSSSPVGVSRSTTLPPAHPYGYAYSYTYHTRRSLSALDPPQEVYNRDKDGGESAGEGLHPLPPVPMVMPMAVTMPLPVPAEEPLPVPDPASPPTLDPATEGDLVPGLPSAGVRPRAGGARATVREDCGVAGVGSGFWSAGGRLAAGLSLVEADEAREDPEARGRRRSGAGSGSRWSVSTTSPTSSPVRAKETQVWVEMKTLERLRHVDGGGITMQDREAA